jgi:large-conductance mechanosensitive channel
MMFEGFKTFMFKHKIPATAAAFSIGGASAEMAKTMSVDIILPFVLYAAHLVYPHVRRQPVRIMPFIGTVVSWGCVLVTSYILMEIVFSRGVLGASLVVMDKKEAHDFEKAQTIAKEPMEQASRAIKEFVVGGIEGAMYARVGTVENAPSEPDAYDKSDHCVAHVEHKG